MEAIIFLGILVFVACRVVKALDEARMRRDHPDAYARLKQIEHEKSAGKRKLGGAVGGLVLGAIARKFLK